MARAPGIGGNRTISPRVQMWVPAQEGGGAAVDLVGGNNFTAAAGNDAMWAVAGFMSSKATGTGTDGSLLAGTNTPINLLDITSESLLLAMELKAPAHAAASRMFGTSATSGSAVPQGFAIGSGTDLTKLGPRMQTTDTTNIGGANEWNITLLDNNTHTLVVMVDGPGGKIYAWVDKVLTSISPLSTFLPGSRSLINTVEPLRIGRTGSSAVYATRLTSIRNLLVARVPGNIPANFSQLADVYALNPFRPWTADVLP